MAQLGLEPLQDRSLVGQARAEQLRPREVLRGAPGRALPRGCRRQRSRTFSMRSRRAAWACQTLARRAMPPFLLVPPSEEQLRAHRLLSTHACMPPFGVAVGLTFSMLCSCAALPASGASLPCSRPSFCFRSA